MTPFESFQIYNGLKLHFTSKYDFIKWRGKTKVKPFHFDKMKDRKIYHLIYEKYKKDTKEFYISCLVSGEPIKWSGELLDDKFHDIHQDRLKRLDSLKKFFSDDVKLINEYLVESGKNFKEILQSNGKVPIIIRLYYDKIISLETIIIINRLTSFVDRITIDDQSWNKTKLLITKYDIFVIESGTWIPSKILMDGIE